MRPASKGICPKALSACTIPKKNDASAGGDEPLERTGKDGARDTGPALETHYRFIVWLVPALERFPRSQKFLLGDRIQNVALDVLESLIEGDLHPAAGGSPQPRQSRRRKAALSRPARPRAALSGQAGATNTRRDAWTKSDVRFGAWSKVHHARETAASV